MSTPAPKPKAPAPKIVKVLPISSEDLRDPNKFAWWIFQHGPMILQELFNTLPLANPNERVKVLSDLYKTTLSYRPQVPKVDPDTGAQDPAATLAALLANSDSRDF